MTVTKEDSGRIIVTFPYDPLWAEKAKTIPGHRWHPDKKYWSFSDTNGTLEKILKAFEGEEICIDPALKAGTSKVKEIPSPLAGEGQGEGYNFEDLRRELISRKYS